MITVFYIHVDRLDKEYSREFEEPQEARDFYTKMQHIKDKGGRRMYIVSYICNTSYEMGFMERIYK